jgi:hypothetical protein
MKKHLVKTLVITGLVALFGVGAAVATVSADTTDIGITQETLEELGTDGYTLEEMLVAALQDERVALAEYQAIIDTYGDIRPFTMIALAEETHIDLLLPLFDAYGIEVPENTAASQVVVPESITAALAAGVSAEQANIAMYETFLAQEGLPEDVANVFALLQAASVRHLNAFSKDRYSYLGTDLMNRIRNMFGKGGKYGNGTNGTGNGARGTGNNYSGTSGYAGICPNA